MRVRQHQVIDRLRVHRQWVPVPVFQVVRPLKQPTIHQKPFPCCFHQIFRTSHASRCTQKRKLCHGLSHLNAKLPFTTLPYSAPTRIPSRPFECEANAASLSACPPHFLVL